jgi:hypothetical protein
MRTSTVPVPYYTYIQLKPDPKWWKGKPFRLSEMNPNYYEFGLLNGKNYHVRITLRRNKKC